MKEEKFLPVSTMVFDAQLGWGKVVGHSESTNYPLKIKFDNGDIELYAFDGKVSLDYKVPVLSLTEYTLENGGFTPISEYWNRPQIGDWGYFWDYTHTNTSIFTQLKDIDSDNKFHTSTAKWDNFSHEIPPYIKKQMEQ